MTRHSASVSRFVRRATRSRFGLRTTRHGMSSQKIWFCATLMPRYNRGMDDREHPSIGTIIIEVAKPMIFGLVVAMLFLPAVMPVLLFVILAIVALGSAPA